MGESMKKIAIVLLAALMLLAISCDEKPQHEHKFSEEWKSNETQHWHECECQEKSGVADHDYETITVESTCSKKGSETVKCKVCGYVKSTKELELKAHTQAEEHVIVKATCSEFGSDSTVCSVCGGTISTTYSAKTDHTSGAPQDIKTATCSEEGLSVVKCTVCDEVIYSTPIACISHTWGVWVPDAESGLQTRTCSKCDATETSGSEKITKNAFGAAMNYDGLIHNVEGDLKDKVLKYLGDSVLSFDNLVYEIKEVINHYDDTYDFEIKLPQEEKYHKVLVTLEYDEEKEGPIIPSFIVDDVEKVVDGYDAFEHPYFQALSVFMSTYSKEPSAGQVSFRETPVVVDENTTYTMTFESNFDSSKYYETRYMKITDEKGKVLLEYTLKLVGPWGSPESIAKLVEWDEIVEAEAVGLFTVDGVSYDIDSVNAVIADMFMPTV